MRVWYVGMCYKEYPLATHWEEIDGDWVELAKDDGEIVAVINWKHVLYMEPMIVV